MSPPRAGDPCRVIKAGSPALPLALATNGTSTMNKTSTAWPGDRASRSTLSEPAALLCARLSLYLKQQPRGPLGTLTLGQSRSDATRTMKHARLKTTARGGIGGLATRSSIFHLPNVLGRARTLLMGERTTVVGVMGGQPKVAPPGGEGAEGARDLSEIVLSDCTSSLGVFEAGALMVMCNGEPCP